MPQPWCRPGTPPREAGTTAAAADVERPFRATDLGAGALYTTEAGTLADALDGLGAGLFVVDATGRIVHATASGRDMLRERLVLRDAEGRLAACEPRASAGLREALAKSASASAGPAALPLSAADGRHSVVHLLPLALEARRSGTGHPALATVLVHRAAIEAYCLSEVIVRFYNLTERAARAAGDR